MPQQYPYQGHYQPPSTPPPPKKKRWPWVVGGVAALIVIGSVVSTTSPKQSVYHPSYPPPSAAAAEAPPAQSGPLTTFSDGTYEVGVDIEPGRYKTAGPDKSDLLPMCYWERAKDDSGTFRSIIANDNLQGPGSVSVKQGEFLKVSGGCTWTKQ